MLSIDISQSSLKIRHFQQNLLSIWSVSCEVLWNMGLVRKEIFIFSCIMVKKSSWWNNNDVCFVLYSVWPFWKPVETVWKWKWLKSLAAWCQTKVDLKNAIWCILNSTIAYPPVESIWMYMFYSIIISLGFHMDFLPLFLQNVNW